MHRRHRLGRSAVMVLSSAVVLSVAAPASAAGDDRVALHVSGFRQLDDLAIRTLQSDGAEPRDVVAPGGRLDDRQWSPDAREFAAVFVPRTYTDPQPLTLRVLAQDGSSQRTLATDVAPFRVAGPIAWTDDGSHVAYISGTQTDTRLSLVRRDGRARAVVDTGVRDMQMLQWSPDGGLVTFTSRTPEGAVGLFAVTPDGRDLRQLADQSGTPERPSGLEWSPDGDRFVYLRNAPDHDFLPRIVRRDGTVVRDLPLQHQYEMPAWAPDGSQIALLRTVEVDGYPDPAQGRVVLLDADTGQERDLGFVPPAEHSLVGFTNWSPDSQQLLVFTTTPAQPFSTLHGFVVDVTTGQGRELVLQEHRLGGADFAPLPTSTPPVRGTDRACAEAPSAGFSDTTGNIFERAIDCVTWYGIARGATDTLYVPGAGVTRPQMAQFLTRFAQAAGVTLDTSDAGFTDLGGLSDEARDAVNAAANLGIARGVTATEFGVGQGVTRGQMASFLVRLHTELSGEDLGPRVHCFADVSASVHRPAAERLCGAGVSTGASRGRYDPAPVVTRQQMAGFLARLLDIGVERGTLQGRP